MDPRNGHVIGSQELAEKGGRQQIYSKQIVTPFPLATLEREHHPVTDRIGARKASEMDRLG
jgi:hypothetical protein